MEKARISHLTGNCVTNLFGTLPDGRQVCSYTLVNANGMQLTVINYGATITSLKVPAANSELVDVVLGFDDIDDYIGSFGLPAAPYFGSIVGRYAGRISNAAFELNGETIKLNANNNGNTLHGGINGFGRAFWRMKMFTGGEKSAITFTYTSHDKEENFPGELTIDVTYTLTEENELLVSYLAETNKPTVLNLTQHSYFNLAGHTQTLENQKVAVFADEVLEITPQGVPTGNVVSVESLDVDYRDAKQCPQSIDNSFVLPQDFNNKAAALFCAETGLKMEVYTNQPSVHIYVGGNCFDKIKGKENAAYGPYSGICFETQNYPDAPNKPQFPDSVLKPGEVYTQTTKYSFKNI